VPAPGHTSPPATAIEISDLLPTLEAVRTNCHITDAKYATDYTLCVYLLKMREYFRWEQRIPFNEKLPQQELTDWLSKNELGFVYSSGYGRNMKPVFYLGALESRKTDSGYTLVVSGKEYARDLASPPAMSQGKTIFVRRESLRRMLWEKVEEWRWNKPANAMQNALGCYDFDNAVEHSLDAMTDNELQSAILHEIGEIRAGELLGDDWEAMLATLPHSRAEIMVRPRSWCAQYVTTWLTPCQRSPGCYPT